MLEMYEKFLLLVAEERPFLSEEKSTLQVKGLIMLMIFMCL